MTAVSAIQLTSNDVRRTIGGRGSGVAEMPVWLPDSGITATRMLHLAEQGAVTLDRLPWPLGHISHVISGRLLANPSTGTQWICHLGIDRAELRGGGPASFVAVIGWGVDATFTNKVKFVDRTPKRDGGPLDLHRLIDELNKRTAAKLRQGWEPRGSNPLELSAALVRRAFDRKLSGL